MTTLIIGGTGRVGFALAKHLQQADRPVLIASRAGKAPAPFKAVTFLWSDANTHENAFTDGSVDRVYIVGPPGGMDTTLITTFIDLAISKGVKRFVLMSATAIKPDAHSIVPEGVAHQYLIDAGVDYTVLRPTWFIQNFGLYFIQTIREHDYVFSATQDGRIPWVSTEDIAQVAFEALTADKSPNKDIFIVGPELYSYSEATKILSSILVRTITHKKYSVEEQAALFIQFGRHPLYAKTIAEAEGRIRKGSEEAVFNDLTTVLDGRKYVGNHTVLEYFQENSNLWIK